MLRPKTVETAKNPADFQAKRDAYEAMGYRVKDYRQGFKATKVWLGRWWLHIILALATRGIGNAIYLAACIYGKRTQVVYVQLASTVPEWVWEAKARHAAQGMPPIDAEFRVVVA